MGCLTLECYVNNLGRTLDVLSIPGGPCDKSERGTSGRITGPLMAEQGKGTLGLWDSGTLGRGGRNGRPRSQTERGQGRDLN